MKTIEEQIKVMQHFANGGKVEYYCYVSKKWFEARYPNWDWSNTDYRTVGEIDPYAELKVAAVDPTKQIRCPLFADDNSGWLNSDKGGEWTWCYRPEEYQIRDKPKLVKVKFLAYATSCGLSWYKENRSVEPHWKRVPTEDKEVEIEK